MISTETGYLKDLANNIILTNRHSLEPLDVLLLIDTVLAQRGESLDVNADHKPSQLDNAPEGVETGVPETTPRP